MRRLAVLVPVLALVALTACGDDSGGGATPQQRDASLYATAVTWFADDVEPPEEGALVSVYLDALGEDDLPIEVQVEVLRLLEDELDVRFIDAEEEAIDEELDGAPVRDDGLLLWLGPVVDREDRIEIDVQRYEREDEVSRYRLVLEPRGEGWSVVGEPEDLPVPTSVG